MKTNTIRPSRARIKGNIIPDWDELLKKTQFEDYHVKREVIPDIVYSDQSYKAIRLNAKAETVYMTVTVDNNILADENSKATITGTLYYYEATNGGNQIEPVPNQLISIYDDEKLIANIHTSSDGTFSYQYSGKSGEHTIKIKSAHENGFDTHTETLTIIVKYETSIVLDPWYTVDVGFGETQIIRATLLDSDRQPVADKAITVMEGYRNLGTYTTNNKGQVLVPYTESSNRGTPTSITVNRNPNLYENMYSIFEGVLTDNNGNKLSGKGVTLFHEYSGHYLASATTDNNGKFSLRYNPLTSSVNPHYYLAFRNSSVTNNEYNTYEPTFTPLGEKEILPVPEDWGVSGYTNPTVLIEENKELGFDTSNWTGNSSRTLQQDGTLLLAYGTNGISYYNTSLPDDDWEIHINADFTLSSSVLRITYNNNVDGITYLQLTSSNTKIEERTLVNGSMTTTKSTTVDNVTSNNNTINNITLRRKDNSIFFEYVSNDTGDLVSYEREYSSFNTNGQFAIQTENGASVELSSLVLIGGGNE